MREVFEVLAPLDNPVLVDIGAAAGCFTLLATLKPMRVLSFEPNPDVFPVLESNCKLNNVNVELHRCALADQVGMASLQVAQQSTDSGLSTLGTKVTRFTSPRSVPVEVRTLDSLNLPRVDFIKIDTEGCEPAVLRGATETIKRCRPSMLLEYCDENLRQCGSSIWELNTTLMALGYKWRRVGDEGDILAVPI
jgi:FkbM family methyltransferase